MDITFTKNFQGHRNGDVYYFDYVSATDAINREYYPSPSVGMTSTVFPLTDATSIEETSCWWTISEWIDREIRTRFSILRQRVCIGKIICLSQRSITKRSSIRRSGRLSCMHMTGVTMIWASHFGSDKIGRRKTLLVPDRLADATSGRLLQKYNEQGEADFELAAIQQTFAIWEQDGRQNGDSIYVYEVTDERLELIRMQERYLQNVEIW